MPRGKPDEAHAPDHSPPRPQAPPPVGPAPMQSGSPEPLPRWWSFAEREMAIRRIASNPGLTDHEAQEAIYHLLEGYGIPPYAARLQ